MSVEIWLDSIDFSPLSSKLEVDFPDHSNDSTTTLQYLPNAFCAIRKRAFSTDAAMESETDNTPRPSKRQREHIILEPSSPASSSASRPTSSISVSSQRSRPISPTKQMTMLEDDHLVFRDFGCEDLVISEDAKMLWMRMLDIADGVGILECSDAELSAIREASAVSDQDNRRFTRPYIVAPHSGHVGLVPWPDVARIVTAAQRCSHTREGESTWNETVHRVVLQAALEASPYSKNVNLATLKGAKLEPKELSSGPLPKRVVDYAYTLNPTLKIETAWQKLQPLAGCATKSWNQTTFSAVRKTPIAVSIETKSAEQSWTDGNPQIAIWTRAYFQRLRALAQQLGKHPSPQMQIPAVPVVIVQGHDWYFCLVLDSCLCETVEQTVVLQSIPIGSTRNRFDTYKVMAALQKLICWTQLEWRPWFESII